jgi:hypothetical protein
MQSDKADRITVIDNKKQQVRTKIVDGKYEPSKRQNEDSIYQTVDPLVLFPSSIFVPARNRYRVIGDLSRGKEQLDAVLDSCRLPLQEDILEGRQHCRTVPDELLQGRHDTYHIFLRQVEALHRGKWT